ncbi:UvrD-helicase domain-containing protein [Bifidobacterium sp. 82T24]|uniref:UvrD-helicase domain-containing protein n=1 Tax=Bifidobacterium pluvialisilvae TaxID=2834436 RepID=UPI001C596FD2|nr:UvrD-helicase domain-containing protein [Bifidobacterium pluvialisilvae]MBW3087447.1 UvrD-helicase domain-containing protein [Bifidobacterium pluvialisilvae]
MTSCKIIIAGAGTGKTTYLVNRALKCANAGGHVLMATYTTANREEIRNKFIIKNGVVPHGVDVITWFSFLLRDGARPFRHSAIPERIEGLLFDNGQPDTGRARKNTHRYYCASTGIAHSGRLSEIVCECNEQARGAVADRIVHQYDLILLDEVQDFAGYDFPFINMLAKAGGNIELVGDPRQRTYSTNHNKKNKKYETIFDYARIRMPYAEIDEDSLNISYRCHESALNIANSLYTQYKPLKSGAADHSGHDGIYLIEESKEREYVKRYRPALLRYDARTKIYYDYAPMNMAATKGMTLNHVLIFPTPGIRKWLIDPKAGLASSTRARFYVALTRARYSAAIAVPKNFHMKCPLIPRWTPSEERTLF